MAVREPVSVVCVYNDDRVLASCLRRSFVALRGPQSTSELITVDNTSGQFPTAGSALGHGAAQARHRVVAFAHQDVVLHSLAALEEAAAVMVADPSIGIAGCCGIDATGAIRGRIRDRVALIGSRAPARGVAVDSLDEVLFLLRTDDVIARPLADLPDLAWHAYAVEYGLRVRRAGSSVVAFDIPVTHNSLTTNLARLDVAHARIAALYPETVPVRTTCGVVRAPAPEPGGVRRALQPHRWRYRWVRESVMAYRGARRLGSGELVLADIRLDIDDILAEVGSISVVNVDDGGFEAGRSSPVSVDRAGHPVTLTAGPLALAMSEVRSLSAQDSLLVTNLRLADLPALSLVVTDIDHLLGYATDLGFWLLLGPAAQHRAQAWSDPRSRPAVHSALRS